MTLNNTYPKKLYRFEQATESRCDTLRSQQLWASSPVMFNDLNDCQVQFNPSANLVFESSKILGAIDILYPNGEIPENSLLTDDILGALRRYFKNYSGKSTQAKLSIHRIPENIRKKIRESTAVCCFFSEQPNSALMWAHYADNHKGFCVEYEVIKTPKDLYEVKYSSKLPYFSPSELLFSPRETFIRIVTEKAMEWAYEKEYRIIKLRAVRPYYYGVIIDFPDWLKPTKVIMGVKLSSSTGENSYTHVSNVAARLKVSLCRVKSDYGKMSIETIIDR
ncbi:MAG: DUF2971 domain-containing protein [Methylococcaceae bacterium]